MNPRHPLGVHLLSRQVASAAHPPLRAIILTGAADLSQSSGRHSLTLPHRASSRDTPPSEDRDLDRERVDRAVLPRAAVVKTNVRRPHSNGAKPKQERPP